jgi:hypothetical protein
LYMTSGGGSDQITNSYQRVDFIKVGTTA